MAEDLFNSFMNGPDEQGRFGIFGGRFVSETLMPLILSLEAEYNRAFATRQSAGNFDRRAHLLAAVAAMTTGRPLARLGLHLGLKTPKRQLLSNSL